MGKEVTMLRKPRSVAVLGLLWCSATAQGQISKVYGIDFSPYLNGQDPNLGSQVTASQITARLQIIAPYTKWIRTFSSTNGLENIPAIARSFGLKVAANAWISSNTTQNAIEISNLIANANAGLVDIAIVGSEAILRNDVTEAQLLTYMNQVRQAIPANVPVTTADVWGTFVAHPNLIAAGDVVFANFYPYWEGTLIDDAVCSLVQEYQQLVAASGSRPVVVSETGWPSAGNAVGAAVPSAANADLFALQYLTWAGGNSIQSFYFEAFDEAWKANSEGPQGAHWGIWDATGTIKPGMDAFFNGQTASVSCNGTIPGPTAIQFVYVPPYGSSDQLEVQVTGVQPLSYVLATYIRVAGSWWTKPTFAQPTVAINTDGTARIAIVTGGIDQLATDIAVFMIPAGSVPPTVGGGALPLVPGTVASLQVSRTQSSISGTITDSQSFPILGATISNPTLGTTKSAPDGKYSFYNIATTGTATLTVSHFNYTFPQSPATVTIPTGNLIVNFSGITAAPGIPSNPYPANSASGVSTTATLSWTAGNGATSHDVYFGTSPSPSFVGNTTQTSYNPGTLVTATTYYWKVVAKNSTGSTSSTTWSFTTAWPNRTPTAVFQDTNGSIRLTRQGSASLYNGGGVFASDPGAAQNSSGDTFVVARDNYNALWAAVFNANKLGWGSWTYGAGITKGVPAIAVATSGTAYIAARDNWNSYWLTSYTQGGGFGSWTFLAGIFSTDPVTAACSDGSIYVVGKDNWGSLWSGRYVPGSGFQGWLFGGGIIQGNPSVTCGTDNTVYVAVRDDWNSLWMARVQGNSWLGWSYGGGIMNGDPQVAAGGNGTIYTVLRDSGGVVWYRGYTEGTSGGWQNWVMTGGVLQSAAPAANGGDLYLAGRDGNNDLWWYRSTGNQWTNIGNRGVAAGALVLSPR